jgi:metal-dependent amidase/aminoacylase/carboxypeptidase family protein
VNQTEPFVLSFGRLEAKGSTNILPEVAVAEGTMRTHNEHWRKMAKEQVATIVKKTAQMFGCKGNVTIREGYPVLINNPSETSLLKKLAIQLFGIEKVVDLPLRMTTDDFSRFAQVIPAVYYRVGVASASQKNPAGLHTPQFLPDLSAMETAITFPLAVIFE